MMKKLMMMMVSGVTVLVLSGCGGGGGDVVVVNDNSTTLFLVDQDGFSLSSVPYTCDGGPIEYTRSDGGFTFYPDAECTFDFLNFEGNYTNDLAVDDIIYIVDNYNDGQGDIPYDCELFSGTTYYDGSFEYEQADTCLFYL